MILVVYNTAFLLWTRCEPIMTLGFPQEVHMVFGKLFERIQKRLDLFIHVSILLAEIFNLVYGMQDGCVMLIAKFPPDMRK
jgi:hypothetical protein